MKVGYQRCRLYQHIIYNPIWKSEWCYVAMETTEYRTITEETQNCGFHV